MSTIVLRSVKGSPLSNAEVDSNFTNLNTDKLEAATTATLTNKTINLASNTLQATSAQIASAVTDETGTGALVFANSPTLVTPALGTPASGVVTNLTGTASININGTVGATTANTGAFTTLSASGDVTLSGATANGVAFANGSKVLTTGSALTFDGTNLGVGGASGYETANRTTIAASGVNSALLGFRVGGVSAGYAFADASHVEFGAPTGRYLSWDINGEQMRLTSTGLGIGTSSPGARLDVVGDARITDSNNGHNLFLDKSAGFGSALQLRNTSTSSNDLIRIIDSGNNILSRIEPATGGINFAEGNVGIGTSSPSAKLDVNGSSGLIVQDNVATGSQVVIGVGTLTAGRPFVGTNTDSNPIEIGTRAATDTIFVTNSTEKMRLDSSGNLGLGVTPSAWDTARKAIQISSTGALVSSSLNTLLGDNWYVDASANKYLTTGAAALYQLTGGTHRWYTAPSGTAGDAISFTQAMSLTDAGTLLVGRTSASDTTVGFEVTSSGRVNCGMASGDAYILFSTSASSYRFYVTNAGTINATSTTITAISDQRLKENIRDLDDGLATVMALKPRKFDWKTGKGKDIKGDRGWIAQEFEQVFPDMIEEWKDPAPEGEEPYKAVNANLIPTLVKAIQELKAEFDAYKEAHP